MRLVCALPEILETLDWDAEKAAVALGMDVRSVRRLLEPGAAFRVDREHLRRLMQLAFDVGYPQGHVFELRPHPLWDPFCVPSKPVILVRGPSAHHDASVEEAMRRFLDHWGVPIKTELPSPDQERVGSLMRSHNCIFVGSPKSNPASEIAIALLWEATAFDGSRENQAKLPLQFVGLQMTEPSCLVKKGKQTGIANDRGVLTAVDWRPADEYRSFSGEAWDAAAVFYCRSPLGTRTDVSTLVIAGFTGRATLRATRELTHGEPALLDHDVKMPGKAVAAVLRFKYRKRTGRGGGSMDALRNDIDGSELWGTPARMPVR